MKSLLTFSLTTTTVLLLAGSVLGQGLNLGSPTHESGTNLQEGSSYRFNHVALGLDAVLTVKTLHNIELTDLQSAFTHSDEDIKKELKWQDKHADHGHDDHVNISNPVWRPTFVGTGGEGLHYADFDFVFYANESTTQVALDNFTTTVFGNPLADGPPEFLIEFVQATGFDSIATLDPSLQNIDVNNLDLANAMQTAGPWLSSWDYEQKSGYSIRFGWQGSNNEDNGRSYSLLMDSPDFMFSDDDDDDDDDYDDLVLAVPEPSSILLVVISVFPLLLRRHRH